jgi:acyl dehydratase
METHSGIAAIEASVGTEVGPTDWFTVDQARINAFADATEDHQWIHVDTERAAAGPFGGTVAHGFLTLSLVPYLASQLRQSEGPGSAGGARMGINYGLDRVRFPAPVPAGARIRARSTLISCDRVGDGAVQLVNRVTIEVEGSEKPACVADTVSRLYF